MSITIIKSGISCSIQDLGRWGYQQYGIPIGGAMDTRAAVTANRICGNDDDAAILECTLHGLKLKFNSTIAIALSGGGSRAFINGIEAPFYKLIKVVSGSELQLQAHPSGFRSYLAISGGFKVNEELGSRSTYTFSKLGGYLGRDLEPGDALTSYDHEESYATKQITIDENGFGISNWKAQSPPLPHIQDIVNINCLHGPEWEWFNEKSQYLFFNQILTVSNQSNRMGYHLEKIYLELKEKKELISSAVTRGIIQVTNEGNPIILMADSQTIGGYPRIGRVASNDLALLAQCRPGIKIQFSLKST